MQKPHRNINFFGDFLPKKLFKIKVPAREISGGAGITLKERERDIIIGNYRAKLKLNGFRGLLQHSHGHEDGSGVHCTKMVPKNFSCVFFSREEGVGSGAPALFFSSQR